MKKKSLSYIRIPYLAVMALTWTLPDMATAYSNPKKTFVYDYTGDNDQVTVEDLGNGEKRAAPIQRTSHFAAEIDTPRPPDVPPALPPEAPKPPNPFDASYQGQVAVMDYQDRNFPEFRNNQFAGNLTSENMPLLPGPGDDLPVDFQQQAQFENPQYTQLQQPQEQPTIKGIYIVNDATKIYPDGIFDPVGVNFDQDVNQEYDDGLRTLLEKTFIGQPIDATLIPCLKNAIQSFYLGCGHPLTLVCVPPQNATCGIIQVIVQEARLGVIRTQGNCWNADDHLKKYISICPGDHINTDELLSDVAWMNRNPFRYTQVSFTPGETPGTTDIELITSDRHPWRIYAGVDNTGSDETSQVRLFTGFTVGNLFGWDNVLSYQYTSSPDFHKYQAHTLNYRVPFTWKHTFMLYGGYAEVHPDIYDFHSSGFSYQASARYTIPLGCLYEDYLIDTTLGFDFKSTNNNLAFTDSEKTSIITGTVNLSQIMAGFNYGQDVGNFELLGSLLLYGSPGELFDNESKKDYQELRYKAVPTYFYGQLYAGLNYNFSWGSQVSFLVRAQQSTENLLPSEQFGIGGFDTVRGYKEREVNTDNGFIVNAELRSPGFQVLGNYFCNTKYKDEIRFIAFFDYGKGFNHRLYHGERRDYQLASVGPGIRYQFMDNLRARLDWGIKLKRSSRMFGWGSKIHFGVIADF